MDPLGFGHLGRPQWSTRGGLGRHGDVSADIGPLLPLGVSSEDVEMADVGSKCDVKQVYGTPNPACQCCTIWEDELPGLDNSAKIR